MNFVNYCAGPLKRQCTKITIYRSCIMSTSLFCNLLDFIERNDHSRATVLWTMSHSYMEQCKI